MGNPILNFDATLNGLNLQFWAAGRNGNFISMSDEGQSPIDNVKHIYQLNLATGRYVAIICDFFR